jgi:esterase/lipase superfamily enzyme
MAIEVHGHRGVPVVLFPASTGDPSECEEHGVVGGLSGALDEGRLQLFCLSSIEGSAWCDRSIPPSRRSRLQAEYDGYLLDEVLPFLHAHRGTPDLPITVAGAFFGAYQAINAILKHPQVFKRCYALSGLYDLRGFMDGEYDEDLYFNNPVDYLPGLTDAWYLGELQSCEIHLVTGSGEGEDPQSSYRLSAILNGKGIRHSLDDWGAEGCHDWPSWQRQLVEYLGRLSA